MTKGRQALFKASLESIVENSQHLQKDIQAVIPVELRHVGLIGCGGTIAQLYPLQYLLDRYGKSFVTTVYNGAELANRRPAYLGPNSLMVASSHSGGTRETVEAVRAAREQARSCDHRQWLSALAEQLISA